MGIKAVVSGATKGIGREIAFAFAKEGFDLALGARTAQQLESFRAQILAANPSVDVLALPCDFSDTEQILRFCNAVKKRWGEIDILVNNVGMYAEGKVSEEADGVLESFISVNFYSAYRLTRGLLPEMKKKHSGHIFNICSVASNNPRANAASYSISKAALHVFSKLLGEEMSAYNIRVTSVLPGPTLTSSWDGQKVDARKLIPPADIAKSILHAFRTGKYSAIEQIVIEPLDNSY